nr:hypothetical protein BaRGS_017915 [Batillaria attramentaria]
MVLIGFLVTLITSLLIVINEKDIDRKSFSALCRGRDAFPTHWARKMASPGSMNYLRLVTRYARLVMNDARLVMCDARLVICDARLVMRYPRLVMGYPRLVMRYPRLVMGYRDNSLHGPTLVVG